MDMCVVRCCPVPWRSWRSRWSCSSSCSSAGTGTPPTGPPSPRSRSIWAVIWPPNRALGRLGPLPLRAVPRPPSVLDSGKGCHLYNHLTIQYREPRSSMVPMSETVQQCRCGHGSPSYFPSWTQELSCRTAQERKEDIVAVVAKNCQKLQQSPIPLMMLYCIAVPKGLNKEWMYGHWGAHKWKMWTFLNEAHVSLYFIMMVWEK